jgi:ribulose-phosphate 3-epimerase
MNVGQQASPPRAQVPTGLAHLAARILASDFPCVGSEVAAAVRAGAERVHVDVMGCHPSEVTAGRLACRALRRVTRAPVEAHLMIRPTPELVAAFAAAGADAIAIHPEECVDVRAAVELVRANGCEVGLALAAGSSLEAVGDLLGEVDFVLVTCATPGPDGQRFVPAALRWIRTLRERLEATGRPIALSVDGGVGAETAGELVAAGADTLVVEPVPCPRAAASRAA